MKFKEEIKKAFNSLVPYNLYLSYGGGYFVGVKKIILVTSEQISVVLSDCKVSVFGVNLKVSKLIDGDLAFSGEVCKIERCKNG